MESQSPTGLGIVRRGFSMFSLNSTGIQMLSCFADRPDFTLRPRPAFRARGFDGAFESGDSADGRSPVAQTLRQMLRRVRMRSPDVLLRLQSC